MGQVLALVLIVAMGSLIADYIKDHVDVWMMNRRFDKISKWRNNEQPAKRRWRRQP